MATKYENRNYSATEKQLFVKIVQKYAETGENKKSSASSLQDKDVAWQAIGEEYNSSIVTEERSVKQLKKLWTNLKQAQRDALTKEKQSRFLTDGGPPSASASVDPEISMIVPHLMTTAPTIFSSSLDEETLKQRPASSQSCNSESLHNQMRISKRPNSACTSYSEPAVPNKIARNHNMSLQNTYPSVFHIPDRNLDPVHNSQSVAILSDQIILSPVRDSIQNFNYNDE